ncbi:MAG: Rieske 2Fe-2S domain-containing protein, partial [Ostreibacterium sp.]
MSNSSNVNNPDDAADKIADCYRDNEVIIQQLFQRSEHYQKQLKDVWYNNWIYVCQSTELPHSGNFVSVNIGDYPLVIVRNQTGKINVLNNNCRHRGSRICQEYKGNASNLVCPYHQWTYDLDGKLVYARNMMEEINPTTLSLKSFACSVINDSVYVNVAYTGNSEETAPYKTLSVKNRHRSAYEYHFQREVGYEDILTELQLSKQLQNNEEATSANVRFYHDIDTDGIIAARVIPVDEHHAKQTLTYLVTSGTSEGKHFTRENFIRQAKNQLSLDLDNDAIQTLYTEPVRAVSPEDLPGLHALQIQELLTKRQEIDYNDVYAPYRLWDSNRQDLVCTMIIKETHNVRTYVFQIASGGWFNYKPGQFITLELPTSGEKTLRTYTLVSSPSRPMSISITIKVQSNSTGTRWIFDHVNVGDILKAYGPNGDFTFFNDPADKYLFISAGSGITPMISMTRWLYDYG